MRTCSYGSLFDLPVDQEIDSLFPSFSTIPKWMARKKEIPHLDVFSVTVLVLIVLLFPIFILRSYSLLLELVSKQERAWNNEQGMAG